MEEVVTGQTNEETDKKSDNRMHFQTSASDHRHEMCASFFVIIRLFSHALATFQTVFKGA